MSISTTKEYRAVLARELYHKDIESSRARHRQWAKGKQTKYTNTYYKKHPNKRREHEQHWRDNHRNYLQEMQTRRKSKSILYDNDLLECLEDKRQKTPLDLLIEEEEAGRFSW
jgi:hypothetical protein